MNTKSRISHPRVEIICRLHLAEAWTLPIARTTAAPDRERLAPKLPLQPSPLTLEGISAAIPKGGAE